MRPNAILSLGVLALIASGHGAWADPAPSADSIINSLAGSDVAKPCAPNCRGIHAIAPSQGPAPPGAHLAPRAPAAQSSGGGGGSLDLSVEFGTGSAKLTPSAERVLSRLGQALTSPRLAGDRFRIEGHTDTVGDPATNQALSEQRAASVVDFLEKKFGVEAARLESVGLGEKDLAVPTAPQTPEPRNRRVHIVNLGA
jgi:outer membrane protein OmpA-like peptidoglycan-associated protein